MVAFELSSDRFIDLCEESDICITDEGLKALYNYYKDLSNNNGKPYMIDLYDIKNCIDEYTPEELVYMFTPYTSIEILDFTEKEMNEAIESVEDENYVIRAYDIDNEISSYLVIN